VEKEAEASLAKERAAASPYCGSDRRDRGKGGFRPRAIIKPMQAEDWRSGSRLGNGGHKAFRFGVLQRTTAFQFLFYPQMD